MKTKLLIVNEIVAVVVTTAYLVWIYFRVKGWRRAVLRWFGGDLMSREQLAFTDAHAMLVEIAPTPSVGKECRYCGAPAVAKGLCGECALQ